MHAIARAGVFMIRFFLLGYVAVAFLRPLFWLSLLCTFLCSKFHNGISFSNLHPYYTVLPRTALCMVCKYCDRSIKMLQKRAFLRSVHYEGCVV
jgi:hypothetical protein